MSADTSATTKAARTRPLSPHVGIYRWKITSVLSILHRGTGIVLALGMIAIVLGLLGLAIGPELLQRMRQWPGAPMLAAALLWSGCLYYHLCNGIRHLFWDMGRGFDLNNARVSGWVVVVATIALTALTWLWGMSAGGAS